MNLTQIIERLKVIEERKRKLAIEISEAKNKGNKNANIIIGAEKATPNNPNFDRNTYISKRSKIAELDFLEKTLPKIKTIPDSNGSKYFDKLNINIGIIADEFLYQSFKDTANFYYVTQKNYGDLAKKIDIFIVVTAWKGLNNEWRGMSSSTSKRREELSRIINYYKENGIKVVFYSKEDPSNYEKFVGIAKQCDFIFTTEVSKIPEYKKDCNNENVFLLEFGVNPIYHNPIGINNEHRKDEILFAGSWYEKYPERQQDSNMIFDGVVNSGKMLKIIDRNFSLNNESYFFPEKYLNYISPEVNHEHLQKIHKLYNWALNLNSIKYSYSMFANRVYELQALGNLVISNYSLAINNKFPNVFLIHDSNEVNEILNGYSKDEIYQLQINGIRQVMSHETTFHRLFHLLECVGHPINLPSKKVAVVVEEINEEILNSFNRQTYNNKELILRERFNDQVKKGFEFVTFFGTAKQYDEFYLEDMINGFKYTNCDYITKDSYFAGDRLVKGVEHNFVNSMKDKYRSVFDTATFSAEELISINGPVTIQNGYSIDHFEFNDYATRVREFKERKYKLSVIIPVYNNGKHLLFKCFNSLKRSSIFEDMEIIIIDDGSTSKDTIVSINRIKKQHSNVKVFFFTDGGSGSASRPRNKGVELSTAPFVTYLDPDNEAVNDGYAKLLSNFDENLDLDMVIGNIVKVDENKSIVFNYYKTALKHNLEGLIENPRQFLIDVDLRAQSIQALIIRKNIITKNDIKMVEKAGGQDTLFFHELLLHSNKSKVINLDIHIYYAAVEGSVTNTVTNRFFEKFYILEQQRLPFLIKNNLLDVYMEKRFNFYFKNWYLKRLPRVNKKDLEGSLETLFKIYSLYKDYIKHKDNDIKDFERLYHKGKFEEIIKLVN